MQKCETALLQAARDVLRTNLSGLNDSDINIEAIESAPAVAGNTYIMVIPGSISRGSAHNPSGGVAHLLIGITVGVILRLPEFPPDRYDEVIAEFIGSMDDWITQVNDELDYQYNVLDAANVLLRSQGFTKAGSDAGQGEGFKNPLQFQNLSPPSAMPASIYHAKAGETRAGMLRRIQYGQAEYYYKRS